MIIVHGKWKLIEEIVAQVAVEALELPPISIGPVPQEVIDNIYNRKALIQTAAQAIAILASLDTMSVLDPHYSFEPHARPQTHFDIYPPAHDESHPVFDVINTDEATG